MSSYICDAWACEERRTDGLVRPWDHCWHESTHRRLAWLYGEERANRISLGLDAATQADKASWEALGS